MLHICQSHLGPLRVKEHLAMIYCRLPIGLEDVSTYPDLFAELVDRGWTEEDLRKLAGKNIIRAFMKAEQVNIFKLINFHCGG